MLVTPREEEPQINVTMANVLIPFPGASVRDVEQMVATPAEQVLSQIAGVEHVMSVSQPGLAVITVQFKVGVPRTEALVRLYDTVQCQCRLAARAAWASATPLIKPKGIDDVPIVTLTLFAATTATGAFDLERVAHSVEADLKRVPGTREVVTIGGPGRAVLVEIDPARLAGAGVDRGRPAPGAAVGQPRAARSASCSAATARWRSKRARSCAMRARSASWWSACTTASPVFLQDVATVRDGAAAGAALCVARHRPGAQAERVPGRHDRSHQEARRERDRRRRRGDAARRRAAQHA